MTPEPVVPAINIPQMFVPPLSIGTSTPTNSNIFKRTSDFLTQCPEYNSESKGVSNECILKLWKNAGCTTGADSLPSPAYNGWWANQKFDNIVSDIKYYADSKRDSKLGLTCYGA